MQKSEAAALLSLEEDEVVDCDDTPAGPVIRTKDGNAYIVVPKDQPDAAGQHGVMYLVPPSPTYSGNFPVFRQPGLEGLTKSNLDDAEDEVLEDLGAELDEAPVQAGHPDAVGPDAGYAHEGDAAATAAALAATGPGTVASEPVEPGTDAPPVNAPDPTDPADVGVVQPHDHGDSEVPDGSPTEVLTWVGDDAGRAAQALRVERAKDRPRTSLVTKLEAIAPEGS